MNGGKPRWIWAPSAIRPIQWNDPIQGALALEPIEITRQVGWRVVCKRWSDQTELWFYGHHALSDGAGGIQFASEWMKIYNNLILGNRPDQGLHRLEPQRLLRRGALFTDGYVRQLWKQPVGLYGAAKFIFRRPAELLNHDAHVTQPWDFARQPAISSLWLDEEQSSSVRTAAEAARVATNSIMVAAFLRHLCEWRERFPDSRDADWFRTIIPMSIRGFFDRRMPATNRAALVQVDRRKRDLADVMRLARGLDREMSVIYNWQLHKIFLLAVRGMALAPGLLGWSAASRKCRGTTIFTNLSEPFGRLGLPRDDRGAVMIGNLKLDDFDFVGPIRWRTPLNLTVQKHIDRFRFSLHTDPRLIEPALAADFLAGYVRHLTEDTAAIQRLSCGHV
jgi:hypothetical protein